MSLFTSSNKIAIHEAGHAVIGWIMKIHCDSNAFEGVTQIFHYYSPENRITAVCHFYPNRATNESALPASSRSREEAITDLAINISGSATYMAYIDINGDPDYPIEGITKLYSIIRDNRLVGADHDFRYFLDIASYDLNISEMEITKFASAFNQQIVNILNLREVKDSVELIAQKLINILTSEKSCLDIPEIEELEEIIFPRISVKEVEEEVVKLYGIIDDFYD